MVAWRNSTENQQSGHAPRSGPEVKNGRSVAEDGALERLGCRTVKEDDSDPAEGVRRRCIKNLRSFGYSDQPFSI